MMEGYAFITLDSSMSDIGDSQSVSVTKNDYVIYVTNLIYSYYPQY
jgi:hypothetical protein